MITMVSIFARSARVPASPPPDFDTRSLLAQPTSAAANPNARSKGWCARTRSTDFMRASIEAYVVTRDRSFVTRHRSFVRRERGLKRPGRADRHSVRVTELRADALVLDGPPSSRFVDHGIGREARTQNRRS